MSVDASLTQGEAVIAEQCAQAAQSPVLFGVRPNARGWFIHCDGIEFDGVPFLALPALKDALIKRARSAESEAVAASRAASSVLALLALPPYEGPPRMAVEP